MRADTPFSFYSPPAMPFDLLLIVELAALGLTSGFLAGLLGIGGGMVMVPFMTVILSKQGVNPELSIKMAIATSMATIVFTSVSSVRAHHKRGAVRWDLVKKLAPGIILGAAMASLGAFLWLKGAMLALIFAFFVSFSASQMLLDKKPAASRQLPGTAGLMGVGSCIGFVSGLVGAGGGFMSVPFMTWCNIAIHNAVATSAALGFPIALANATGFAMGGLDVVNLPDYALGYIWLPGLAVIALCSVTTAPLGAKAAHQLPVKQLKRVFASVLYLLAAYMLFKGIQSW
jgi:uncharacterized membrane protein YfcA